jgi:hypothetical protein
MRYEYFYINRCIIIFYVGIKRLFRPENVKKKFFIRKVFSSYFVKKRYKVRIFLHKSL